MNSWLRHSLFFSFLFLPFLFVKGTSTPDDGGSNTSDGQQDQEGTTTSPIDSPNDDEPTATSTDTSEETPTSSDITPTETTSVMETDTATETTVEPTETTTTEAEATETTFSDIVTSASVDPTPTPIDPTTTAFSFSSPTMTLTSSDNTLIPSSSNRLPSSSSTPTALADQTSEGLSQTQKSIIGGVVGGVLGLLLVGALIVWSLRRTKKQREAVDFEAFNPQLEYDEHLDSVAGGRAARWSKTQTSMVQTSGYENDQYHQHRYWITPLLQ